MAVPKIGKPALGSVVFVPMRLALVVVRELVDCDKGVRICFKEQVDR